MGQVFKKDGLVSSPMQERAQMIFALSQELSRTVSEIDGVLSARVHLVLPENDPLRQQLVPSSASVFIRHRSNMPVGNLVPQVKMLVANGVAGLSYDKVSVVLVPVDAQKASQSAGSWKWSRFSACGCSATTWRRRCGCSSASSRWSSCSQVRSPSSSFASADAFMHWVRRARLRRAQ